MSAPPALPPQRTWRPLLELALAEDLGPGDLTTPLVVEADRTGTAVIESRQDLVVCGLDIAAEVFRAIDPDLGFEFRTRDGARARAGEPLAIVSGRLRAILAGERTALNFLARLCGVSTWTRRFVSGVEGTGALIVDTRNVMASFGNADGKIVPA